MRQPLRRASPFHVCLLHRGNVTQTEIEILLGFFPLTRVDSLRTTSMRMTSRVLHEVKIDSDVLQLALSASQPPGW